MVEWEILRHRRLVAAAIRDESRYQAAAAPIREGTGFSAIPWFKAEFGRKLMEGDAKALSELRKAGVTLPEVTAAAIRERFTTVAYHEGRIADLEKRRRALRPEYEALKAKRPPVDDIEDAVEVE